MPKATYIQTNFTSGELSPRLNGRVDISKYANGVKTLRNMVTLPQGGASRRGGSKYIASGKTNTKKVRLVSFEFSVTQAYVLEFGHNYIRFYKDGGVIEGGSPTAPIEVSTTYTEAELYDLQFTQSADTLFIAHKDHEPATLSRTSHIAWALADYELLSGPVLSVNTTGTTFTPSATSGDINITASATTGVNGGDGFTASDVNRIIKITQSTTTGFAKINSITSTTIVACTVTTPFHDGSGVTTWALGHFHTGNFPQSVAFYEQRLVWSGAPNNPQTLAFSVSGDYSNHLAGSNASDAMVYTIATDQVNAIKWMNPGPVLIVGTAGGEFIVSASASDEALTPTNVRVTRQTTYGSYSVVAKRVSNVVLFLQRAQRKIREFVYKFETDTYVAPDLTLLAEHITETGIIEMDYQQEPDSILWCVLTDGTLAGMTYQRDQEVIAWHKHIMGGASDIAGTQAKVESVAVIPGTAGDGAGIDEIWVSVLRWVNGAQARHIEVINPGLESSKTQEDAFFVDSGLSLDVPLVITAATQAKPVVITSSSHGISDGSLVDIRNISGTTELNNQRYRVIESTTNTFEIMAVKGVSIFSATKASPCVITAYSHGFASSDQVGFIGVGGMTQLNGNGYTVTKINDDSFSIGVDSSSYGTYTNSGTVHLNTDGTNHTAYVSGGTARVATTSVSGLNHLEGETVAILANGAVQPTKTVSSGAITLSTPASIIHAGLPYTSKLVTMNLEAGSEDGTAQSKTKRIYQVTVRLYRSLGLEVGPENGSLDLVSFRDSADLMNSPPSLFTGDKDVLYPQSHEASGNVEVQQTQPLPQTILALIMHVKTNN